MSSSIIPYENGVREISTTTEDEISTNQNNPQSGFWSFWSLRNGQTNPDGQSQFPSISITNIFASNQRNAPNSSTSYRRFSNRYLQTKLVWHISQEKPIFVVLKVTKTAIFPIIAALNFDF